ncbi:hypothetical protein Bbelb_077020 [Branchiostoma belcheri]|nr:hypothetical protein Bbelb_077020 [Branchiostoma belcheri]
MQVFGEFATRAAGVKWLCLRDVLLRGTVHLCPELCLGQVYVLDTQKPSLPVPDRNLAFSDIALDRNGQTNSLVANVARRSRGGELAHELSTTPALSLGVGSLGTKPLVGLATHYKPLLPYEETAQINMPAACRLLQTTLIVAFLSPTLVRTGLGQTGIQDGGTVYVTAGSNADLQWSYTLPAGITPLFQTWRKLPDTGIASKTSVAYISPAYQGRVELFGMSGLRLKDVTTADSGTYQLYVVSSDGTSQTLQLTLEANNIYSGGADSYTADNDYSPNSYTAYNDIRSRNSNTCAIDNNRNNDTQYGNSAHMGGDNPNNYTDNNYSDYNHANASDYHARHHDNTNSYNHSVNNQANESHSSYTSSYNGSSYNYSTNNPIIYNISYNYSTYNDNPSIYNHSVNHHANASHSSNPNNFNGSSSYNYSITNDNPGSNNYSVNHHANASHFFNTYNDN